MILKVSLLLWIGYPCLYFGCLTLFNGEVAIRVNKLYFCCIKIRVFEYITYV